MGDFANYLPLRIARYANAFSKSYEIQRENALTTVKRNQRMNIS